jgi:hypothetical protein
MFGGDVAEVVMPQPRADRFTFDWIRGIYYRDRKYPPRTTAADLDAAEKELNVRFPASYRAFAQRFGLGGKLHTLPTLFPLATFPDREESYWWFSVIDATRFHRSAAAAGTAPADFLRWAVVFGIDEGEHTFVFHTGEVTDPAQSEYRIYDIPRHEDPEPIADTFEAWLRWIDDGYRLGDDGSEEEQNKERLRLEFDPDSAVANPMPYWRAALE